MGNLLKMCSFPHFVVWTHSLPLTLNFSDIISPFVFVSLGSVTIHPFNKYPKALWCLLCPIVRPRTCSLPVNPPTSHPFLLLTCPLWPHGPPYCSLNTINMLLPPGLCSDYWLFLKYSSHLSFHSRVCSPVTQREKPSSTAAPVAIISDLLVLLILL